MTARPGEANGAPLLESKFGVFEAPLEDYDVVELTRFDRPLARGRVAFGDGFAVVGPITRPSAGLGRANSPSRGNAACLELACAHFSVWRLVESTAAGPVMRSPGKALPFRVSASALIPESPASS
ncbi:hypothetical protein BMF89_01560 [Arthrobacter sp. SRS-W-1-2016]|uniref:hypothetical protein n=1 Tax=Arthrobacter TaxID=1663 RepID=UPI00099107A0|nr:MULTISPECIES: hypothetical protein [Arthrobacter]MDQ0213438.1 hypothetical protein [Arthrobacter bambusae]MDQ0237738.1 hypothetical protein [Arthrobacter bambusae]OOP64854.1 hypothetical protein BMF89_01560 [Arthrobacter sp. SRS-W-1-2016]